MRTDHRALAALDACRRLPLWEVESEIAFLEARRAGGKGPVERHGADWELVAAAGENLRQHVRRRQVARLLGSSMDRGNWQLVQVPDIQSGRDALRPQQAR